MSVEVATSVAHHRVHHSTSCALVLAWVPNLHVVVLFPLICRGVHVVGTHTSVCSFVHCTADAKVCLIRVVLDSSV